MRKTLFYIAFSFLLCSCRHDPAAQTTFSNFPVSKSLKGYKIFKETFVEPAGISLVKKNLIVIDNWNDTLIHVFDIETKKYLRGAGIHGQKDGEMLVPIEVLKNDDHSFWVYDFALTAFYRFNTDSLLNEKRTKPDKTVRFSKKMKFAYFPVWVSDSMFVSPYIGPGGRIIYGNNHGEFVKVAGEFPPLKPASISDTTYSQVYQSTLCTDPDRTKIAVAARYADQIEIYSIKGGKTGKIVGPEGFLPSFQMVDVLDNKELLINSKSKFGYTFVQGTKKYIYALYSGRTSLEAPGNAGSGYFLNVFDWTGKPVKQYKLDNNIYQFAIKDKEDGFYAISVSPTPQILEYRF